MKIVILTIMLLLVLNNFKIEIVKIAANYYKIYLKIFCVEFECSAYKDK